MDMVILATPLNEASEMNKDNRLKSKCYKTVAFCWRTVNIVYT